jgi:hypothetical protein
MKHTLTQSHLIKDFQVRDLLAKDLPAIGLPAIGLPVIDHPATDHLVDHLIEVYLRQEHTWEQASKQARGSHVRLLANLEESAWLALGWLVKSE